MGLGTLHIRVVLKRKVADVIILSRIPTERSEFNEAKFCHVQSGIATERGEFSESKFRSEGAG
jgi:hypothetical protein